jgi:nitrate/TMAO reductase-like tetraheme cytochrome c subunit
MAGFMAGHSAGCMACHHIVSAGNKKPTPAARVQNSALQTENNQLCWRAKSIMKLTSALTPSIGMAL